MAGGAALSTAEVLVAPLWISLLEGRLLQKDDDEF